MKHFNTTLVSILAIYASPICAQDDYPALDVLLSSTTSILGQNLVYPAGQAEITSAIVTMQPGEKTGWHKHNVPLFAYVLEGQVSVDYGPDGVKTYTEGDSFIEAFLTDHRGENTGSKVVRILTVLAGAQGTASTVMRKIGN